MLSQKPYRTTLPSKMHVRVAKSGWVKRFYEFAGVEEVLGELRLEKAYKATGLINGNEFEIRRTGFWKHFLEIKSTYPSFNHRIPIDWRSRITIHDAAGNPFTFKSVSVWRSKWQWLDPHERPIIEIKSNIFSKKNRGSVEVLKPEMEDHFFWILVAWFVIVCSESDAAAAA